MSQPKVEQEASVTEQPEEAVEVPFMAPGDAGDTSLEAAEEAMTTTNNTNTNTNNGPDSFDFDFDFVDHFSLKQSSASVRFRDKHVRIYDLANDQIQLEHRVVTAHTSSDGTSSSGDDKDGGGGNHKGTPSKRQLQITMQRMRGGSLGLRVLRTLYTLASLLLLGFLFVFASQAVVYQMMEIPRVGGTNRSGDGKPLDTQAVISAALSIPVVVYSMGSLMVFGMVFVGDTWNGHVLFGFLLAGDGESTRRVAVEWLCFVMYIAVPVIGAVICFFAKVEDASNVALLIWYCCMNITFFLFAALATYHEIKLCLDLTRILYGEGGRNSQSGIVGLIQKAVLTTLTQRYAGSQEKTYLHEADAADFDPRKSKKGPTTVYMGPYSRTTALNWNPFFDRLDPPIRRYAMEEIRETTPYVTNQTWSLEKMCCRIRNGRSRLVVKGPNALESSQYKSTLACTIVSIILVILFTVGFLGNMGQGVTIQILVGVVLALCVGVPYLMSAMQLYKSMPSDLDDDSDFEDDGKDTRSYNKAPHFQTWAAYTITKPKEWYCWFRFSVAFFVLFLYPMASKFASGLPKNGTFFLVIGLVSGVRMSLDAGSIIKEHGSMSNIDLINTNNGQVKNDSKSEHKAKTMIARARATEVMGKISSSSRLYLWMIIYSGLSAYFLYAVLTYSNGEGPAPQTGRPPILVLNDFYYPGQPDMSYPTCRLNKEYAIPGRNTTHITDYTMLAALGYEITNITDYVLDQWFQEEDFFVDETPLVAQWKNESGYADSEVSFKLFSIPSQPGFGVVSIRGTETPADRLLNSQLYISSVFTQAMEYLIPFGWIFTSIYPDLVRITGWIGSEQLVTSNYYSIVTDFVNDLTDGSYTYEGKSFDTLRVTGVSLGGGLAMIVGAQTDAFAIAFAGPSPMLARKTMIPPISLDDINTRVLNVVPDTDFVSRIGGPVRNTQHITCRKWDSEQPTCHSFWRQMCEFMYSCGSEGRPVLCVCSQEYGYPEPSPSGNRTYAEACAQEEVFFQPYM